MFLAAAAAAALVSASGNAAVTNKPTTFQVTANVVTNCTIGATDMTFLNYDPVGAQKVGGTAVTATSDITVVCTKGSTGVSVGLDLGQNPNAGVRQLVLTGGTDVLSYSINDDAGSPWTQTSTTVGTVTTVTGGVNYTGFNKSNVGVKHVA